MCFLQRQAFIKQKGVQAVIFDMAGTVIDWGSSAPVEAFKVVFAEAGVDAREEEARAPMGLGKRDHIKAMLSQDRLAAAWSEAKGRPHTDEDIEELYEQFTPAQVKAARSHSDLIPGTVETLAAARAMGARIGACTGYNDVIMAAVMEQARERGFDPDAFMFCFNDNSNARPKPWMSTQLAAMMDASPLHTCVKVDDTTPGIYGEPARPGVARDRACSPSLSRRHAVKRPPASPLRRRGA